MCRLLLGHGAKPELTLNERSPLAVALGFYIMDLPLGNAIDTFRCFLDDADLVDEFNRIHRIAPGNPHSGFKVDETEWCWQKNSELLIGEDLRSNQRVMIRRFWAVVGGTDYRLHCKFQFPTIQMDRDILSDIQHGHCRILNEILLVCNDVVVGYVVGAWLLDWLVDLGLDPELFVASERESLKTSEYIGDERPVKRLVFERNREQKWVLGFKWVFDHQAPGYTLVSEYTALAVERDLGWSYFDWGWSYCSWPFSGDYLRNLNPNRLKSDAARARFDRRMAAKERKERVRSGGKQTRSGMPGAWK